MTTNQEIPGLSPDRVDILLHIVLWIISLNKLSHIPLDLQLPTGQAAKWISFDYESGDSRFESWYGRYFVAYCCMDNLIEHDVTHMTQLTTINWPCGPMDKASDYESGD